jgi:hypothetical protein
MAYTSIVEFVWLPAATSPGPAHPQKLQILPKRPTPSPLLTEPRPPDAASRRKQLTTQPVVRALRRNVWWKRGLLRCARNDGERFRPAFFDVFSVAAEHGATLEQKVNFCLHAYAVRGIYVYSGIRVAAGGDFARPGPPSKNPDPSEAAHTGPRPPPLRRACPATSTFALFLPRLAPVRTFLTRFPGASSADATGRRNSRLRNQWCERFEGMSRGKVDCVAALAMTGGAVPPGFLFAVFSVAAAPCAKLEQKVNFCLHAYAAHGIYVYSGIRVVAGGDFARPPYP